MPPPKDPIKREEWIRKMSLSQKGKPRHPHNEETKKKMSLSHKGKSSPNKGVAMSEEQKRKISNSNIGKVRTEEVKKKLSLSHKGIPCTEEVKKKLSLARKGIPKSEETKKKLSLAHKGKSLSEECKKKMSLSRKGKYCGELHPGWKGGISFEPYCPKFNNDLKKRVRLFWSNKCGFPECGILEDEYCGKLSVHHVHYDKNVCCNDRPVMFIPLCKSCHSKTNHDRKKYKELFEKLIMDKFGGKSYYTKEEYEKLKNGY